MVKKTRRRPSAHYRYIKTNNGFVRKLINPSIVKKKKVISRLTPSDRKLFKQMSDPSVNKKEYGGAIDFKLDGSLEEIRVVPGTSYDVELDPDFEVQYHTHPDANTSPPSPEDVMALLNNKEQKVEIVFRDGDAFVIIDTPKTKKLKQMTYEDQKKYLYLLFNRSSSKKDFETSWKETLQKLGFKVIINKEQSSTMKIPLTAVED